MRKIGGINMNTITRYAGKFTREKTSERYCSVYESLEESLKEVMLIKQGKIKPKTWKQVLEELGDNKE